MTKPFWIVQTYTPDSSDARLIAALDKTNCGYINYRDRRIDFSDDFIEDECIICRGSIQFVSEIQRKCKWIPGTYYTKEKYLCSSYYPYFGEHLLNSDYIILPFGDLTRRKEWIFDTLGEDRTIFLRPNSGGKVFTGTLINKETFEKDIHLLGPYNIDKGELCVVSRPYNLTIENRYVVVKNKVITGSSYRDEKNRIIENHVPLVDFDWIQGILDEVRYEPDPAWVVDTCITKGGKQAILEINSFSCSGLYGCDMDKVVKAVNEVALEEWGEYHV